MKHRTQLPLVLAVALLAGAPGCLTIAWVERLSDTLEASSYAGVTSDRLAGDVRVLTVRYRSWRNGATHQVRYRFEPEQAGSPLSTEEARRRVPRESPPPHHVARWIVGGALVPFTAVADLASLPFFPFNVWVAVHLDVIEII
jgi:hypothetical protein